MEPVRDHQLDLRFATRGDHLSTFLNRDRHRFFAQNMDTGPGCSDRVVGVHGVRESNVDGVDDTETLVELLVGEGVVNPIPPGHLSAFGTVPADDRHQLGVAACVRECRNHRDLRDVPEAHDAVSNPWVCRRHLVSPSGVVQSWSQSASGSGASAGPEITSPVGLKRDP